jgi:hypothetical protein
MRLSDIIPEAKCLVREELGIDTGQEAFPSQLRLYGPSEWCGLWSYRWRHGFPEGMYDLHSGTAHLLHPTAYLIPNAFQYYLGEGLFSEQSELGRTLTERVRKEELIRACARAEPSLGFAPTAASDMHGFALWLEDLLSCSLGQRAIWEVKRGYLRPGESQLLEQFQGLERKITRFGFLSQLGFQPQYTSEELAGFLRSWYNDTYQDIDFAVQFGPLEQRQFVHLLVAVDDSRKSMEQFGSWMHVLELTRHDLRTLVQQLDTCVTDALFGGRFVCGSRGQLESYRHAALTQRITPDALERNRERARSFGSEHPPEIDCPNYFELYREAYAQNARALEQRMKPLTINRLLGEGIS